LPCRNRCACYLLTDAGVAVNSPIKYYLALRTDWLATFNTPANGLAVGVMIAIHASLLSTIFAGSKHPGNS